MYWLWPLLATGHDVWHLYSFFSKPAGGGWCLHSLWWSIWWTATQLFLLSLIYLSANNEEAAATLHRLAPFLLGWNVVSSLLVSPNTSWRCTAEQHQKDVVPNTVTVIRQSAYCRAQQNADSPSQNDNDEEEVVKTVQTNSDLIQQTKQFFA